MRSWCWWTMSATGHGHSNRLVISPPDTTSGVPFDQRRAPPRPAAPGRDEQVDGHPDLARRRGSSPRRSGPRSAARSRPSSTAHGRRQLRHPGLVARRVGIPGLRPPRRSRSIELANADLEVPAVAQALHPEAQSPAPGPPTSCEHTGPERTGARLDGVRGEARRRCARPPATGRLIDDRKPRARAGPSTGRTPGRPERSASIAVSPERRERPVGPRPDGTSSQETISPST